MATLKMKRSNEYANRLRDIKIFLDGKEVGKIGNAETKDFQLVAGNHLLQAKIDWCTSNKVAFTISENETKNFNITSFAKHNFLGIFASVYYVFLRPTKYLTIEEISA